MTPWELMAGASVTAVVGSPEMDPLTEQDALACAPLVEVVFDAVNMRLGLLFDLRVAEQLRMANTGLIVLGGVESFQWRAEQRATPRTSWNVDASVPSNKDGLVNLGLVFFPDAELAVTARSAALFFGGCAGAAGCAAGFRWQRCGGGGGNGVDGLAVRAGAGDVHRAAARECVTRQARVCAYSGGGA